MTQHHDNHPDRHSASPDGVEPPYDLFNQPADEVSAEVAMTATEKFELFHQQNPGFYDALVRLARRYIGATGRSAVGMQRLIEIARWDVEIATKGDEEFKVNNDHAAFYSRLIMWQEPDLAGAIPIRSSPAADQWIALIKHGSAA